MDSNSTEQEPDDADSYRARKKTQAEATGNQSERSDPILDATDDELDALLTLLANPRRRGVIQLLDDHGALSRDILTAQIAARETDAPPERVPEKPRKAVYVSLYQTHLPALAEDDIIAAADPSGNIVAPGERFDDARAILMAIEDTHADEPDEELDMPGADEAVEDFNGLVARIMGVFGR